MPKQSLSILPSVHNPGLCWENLLLLRSSHSTHSRCSYLGYIQGDTNVLEIGFGCGYSADHIQELSPQSHTIVEPDPVVLVRLREWAKGRRGVLIVEGFWQTALPALGTYDAVFFDDFPVRSGKVIYPVVETGNHWSEGDFVFTAAHE